MMEVSLNTYFPKPRSKSCVEAFEMEGEDDWLGSFKVGRDKHGNMKYGLVAPSFIDIEDDMERALAMEAYFHTFNKWGRIEEIFEGGGTSGVTVEEAGREDERERREEGRKKGRDQEEEARGRRPGKNEEERRRWRERMRGDTKQRLGVKGEAERRGERGWVTKRRGERERGGGETKEGKRERQTERGRRGDKKREGGREDEEEREEMRGEVGEIEGKGRCR
ncbi:hypothetical protein Tco_1273538 [Tanacetum coccineum]